MALSNEQKDKSARTDRQKKSWKQNGRKFKRSLQNQKSRGLPRPKSQISYNIPRNIQALVDTTSTSSSLPSQKETSRSRSSTPTSNHDSPLIQFSRINLLLSLVHRRNKNQHHSQLFWKWLRLLRHSIDQLVTLHHRLETLQQNQHGKSASGEKSSLSSESIRKTFEVKNELRSQRDSIEEWIRETLVPGCYVAFSCVVGDTQFAGLGVVLMGILADVAGRVGGMKRVDKVPSPLSSSWSSVQFGSYGKMSDGLLGREEGSRSRKGGDVVILAGNGGSVKSVLGVSTLMTGPDQGEVIERIFSDGDGEVEDDTTDEKGRVVVGDRGTDEGVRIQRKRETDGQDLRGEQHKEKEEEEQEEEEGRERGGDMDLDQSASPPAHDKSHTTTKSEILPSPLSYTQPSTSTSTSTSTSISNTDFISHKVTKPADLLSVRQPSPGRISSSPGPPLALVEDSEALTAPPSKSRTKIHKIQPGGMEQKKDKKKKKKKGNAIDDLFGGLF